ncbi:MAG: hypothetical protein KGQ60_04975 [Planctomycetes bacterium]|nr:hypothetical protein [Planctomycetota bacterium]
MIRLPQLKTFFRISCWVPLYLWVGPWTLIGLAIGFLPGVGQRRIRFHRGTVGIYGPGVERLLLRAPVVGGASAMTIGHTILACNESIWRETFKHEFVHVRQYQWFGPFFVPAYLLESFWQWIRGRNPYSDNRFEVQARKYS